jgi:hypothetical protein
MLLRSRAIFGVVACLGMSAFCGSSRAAGPNQLHLEFFEKEIRPLLIERCFKCHGEKKAKSGLRLDSRAAIFRGGDTGPAAVPGDPDASLMIQAIRHQNGLKMPPKERLTTRQIENLAYWVRSGLAWPERSPNTPASKSRPTASFPFTQEQRNFWSFQPVKDVTPPKVDDRSWPQSEIDRFILATLEARHLHPAKPADKRSLLRRATFDLTGLPPTPEEIDGFLGDDSPGAFARVVDRLLGSAQYGERWGRHWLDVVRYTDSFDARIVTGDGSIMDATEAYRYRDWVIQAFNQDLPYDQFIIHQIAGDLIPAKEPGAVNASGIVATGMLAIGNWGGGDADKEKLLTDIADDQVDVVSRAFLGITMACARCHDHKFDPLLTEDYYALAGIFFSTHILADPGPKTNGPPMLRIPLIAKEEVARRAQIHERIASLEKELLRAKLLEELLDKALGKEPAAKSVKNDVSPEKDAKLARFKAELESLEKNPLPPIPYANGAQEGGCPLSPQAGIHDVRVHIRGRYDRLGPVVPRRFPIILAGENQKPDIHGSGRMELAHWIASPANPLTARVMVNRIWQHHFGEGLVRTPGNFGKLGEPPTHPELLDYLARFFVRSGWSVKALHRAIMLSAVYQQSSVPEAETFQADPENRLFGRMNRRRLEAEELRDALLAVAGRLNPAMGGRATRDFNLPRRSVYLMTIRSDRSSFRELFDAADPTAIADKRTVSTVAPQALFLLNHPFALEETRHLVRRLLRAVPGNDDEKVIWLYSLLYCRLPTSQEIAMARSFLARALANRYLADNERSVESGWLQYCQVLLCANEFIYVD